MGSRAGQYCRCGTRLAADNSGHQCARCERASRDKLIAPPEVPTEFWQTEQLRDAFAAQHMGWVARAYRTHPYHHAVYGPSGISQGLLGQWLGLSQPQVSRIENGPPIRNLDTLAYWARVLHIPPALLWFRLPGQRGTATASSANIQHEKALAFVGLEETDNLEPTMTSGIGPKLAVALHVSPSELASVLSPSESASAEAGGVAGDFGLGPTVTRNRWPRASTVDEVEELLAHLRQQWHVLVKTDNLFGPRYALGGVRLQLQLLEELVHSARASARSEFVRLAAQYAESAAWLYEDSGDLAAAKVHNSRAMEWAHEVGDDHLLAWTLFRQSQQAAYRADAAGVIGLSQAARRNDAVLTPPMRAAIAQQEAHGYALDGDETMTQRLLDESHRWATADTAGDAREGHGSFCTASYVEIQRAACWLRLGNPQRSIDLYEAVLPTLPSVYRRDRGVALSRCAVAHLAAGDPERAASVASDALQIALSVGSQRTLHQVRAAGRRLAPHRGLAPVGAFLDELSVATAS